MLLLFTHPAFATTPFIPIAANDVGEVSLAWRSAQVVTEYLDGSAEVVCIAVGFAKINNASEPGCLVQGCRFCCCNGDIFAALLAELLRQIALQLGTGVENQRIPLAEHNILTGLHRLPHDCAPYSVSYTHLTLPT